MAKINFGPVVNDARGKTAGIVYSKNRSGAYVRTKVTPTNPKTGPQVQARTNLGIWSQAWSGTLTATQRAAWTTFANSFPIVNIFGLSINLNGLNMLVRVNTALAQIGASPLLDPPVSPATTPIPVDPTMFSVSSVAVNFYSTAAAPTAGTLFYVFGTRGLPAGRNPTPSDYRFVGHYAAPTTSFPAAVNAFTEYAAIFGTPITGQKVSLLVSTIDPTVGIPTLGVPMSGIV